MISNETWYNKRASNSNKEEKLKASKEKKEKKAIASNRKTHIANDTSAT